MDKNISKIIFRAENIPTADWIYTDTKNTGKDILKLGFPCVLKPCSCGSSVGVSMINNISELQGALIDAEKFDEKIIIERKIDGREFSVGILNDKALPPVEIRPKGKGFYDFTKKYQSGCTEEICPAPLSKEQNERLCGLALKAHRALGLSTYSRIDFMLDNKTGEFFILEANTLPGMTPLSLLPIEAKAAGISYKELCETIALAAKDKK